MSAIRKAVFPAAGLGTRFLPATKASPSAILTRDTEASNAADGNQFLSESGTWSDRRAFDCKILSK